MMKNPRCGICDAKGLKLVFPAPSRTSLTRLVRCSQCAVVQVSPLPAKGEVTSYYEAYSYLDEKAWETAPAVLHSLSTLALSLQRFRQLNTLLDVGCGAGQLLRVFRHHGWEAYGADLSIVAARRLRAQGFSVYQGDLASLRLPERSFDIVLMTEVIEHLREPVSTLKKAFSILRPGGALYLTTPTFSSLSSIILQEKWRVIEIPEHLFYFSPHSLSNLLEITGYRSVSLASSGINPFEIRSCLTNGRTHETVDTSLRSTASLRDYAFEKRLGRLAKRVVNFILDLTGTGDTLKAVAIK